MKIIKSLLVLVVILLTACIPFIKPEPEADKCINLDTILTKYNLPDEYSLHQKWWDMTKEERVEVTSCIVSKTGFGNAKAIRRSPDDEWESALCVSNSIIRWARFSDSKRYLNQDWWSRYAIKGCNLNTCEYKTTKGVFPVIPEKSYKLPCYFVNSTGNRPNGKFYGHTVNAIQVGKDINNLDSWYFFQYTDNPIIPWKDPSQIPSFTKISIIMDNPSYMYYKCSGTACYSHDQPCVLVEWQPKTKTEKVLPSTDFPVRKIIPCDVCSQMN